MTMGIIYIGSFSLSTMFNIVKTYMERPEILKSKIGTG